MAANSDFSKVLFETSTFTASGSNLSATCPITDLGKGTFYWRVQTIRQDYRSAYSPVWNFEVTKAPVGSIEKGYVMKKDIDAGYYTELSGMRLTNQWVRSVDSNYANMSFDSNGALNRGFTVSGDKIYVSGRYSNSSSSATYLDVYDTATGERINRLALGDEASVDYFPCNDVMTDAAGHVIVSNLSLNISTQPLQLFEVNTTTGAVTRLASLTYSGASTSRVDHCAVYGDVSTGNYYVFAAMSSGTQLIRWTIRGGAVASSRIANLAEFVPSNASNVGIAARVIPVNENIVYVKGSTIYRTRYNFSTGAIDSKMTKSYLMPAGLNANGFASFELRGKHYILYPNGDNNCYFNYILAQNTAGDDLDGFMPMWIFPRRGLGSVYSQTWGAPCVAMNTEGASTVMMYVYVPGNGMAAYKLSTVAVPGDVNRDGTVDVTDVTTLINMILGTLDVDYDVADIDGNGTVDVTDVTALINMVLK